MRRSTARGLASPLLGGILTSLVLACGTAGLEAGRVDAQIVPTTEVDTLSTGVVHSYTIDPEGPWAIHLVEIAPDAPGIRVGTVAALDRVTGVERTSTMAERTSEPGRPVLAAVNADFFRAEPYGVPEGPQVAGGEVVVVEGSYGPSVAGRFDVAQPAFGVTGDGEAFVGEVAFAGRVWHAEGSAFPVGRVNAPPGPDSLALYTRYADGPVSAGPRHPAVEVRLLAAPRAAGDTVRGVVVERRGAELSDAGEAARVTFTGRGRAAAWLDALVPGDTLMWTLGFEGAPGPVRELTGGFPLLVRAGEPVLDRVPRIHRPFSEGRHPRTAAGIGADGTVYLVVVDGRQPPYSDGMTLNELTRYLLDIGIVDAINLDGGGSTTLVVGDEIVNRPSTAGFERPVANAVILWRVNDGLDGPSPD